jgi:hypothetical protein
VILEGLQPEVILEGAAQAWENSQKKQRYVLRRQWYSLCGSPIARFLRFFQHVHQTFKRWPIPPILFFVPLFFPIEIKLQAKNHLNSVCYHERCTKFLTYYWIVSSPGRTFYHLSIGANYLPLLQSSTCLLCRITEGMKLLVCSLLKGRLNKVVLDLSWLGILYTKP